MALWINRNINNQNNKIVKGVEGKKLIDVF